MQFMLVLFILSFGLLGCSNTGFQGTSKSQNGGGEQSDSDDGNNDSTDDSGDEGEDGEDGGLFDDGTPGDDGNDKTINSGDGFDNIDSPTGNANVVREDAEKGVRAEIFKYGDTAKQDLVDYLFVLDNSCSMGAIITKTTAGFKSLVTDSGDIFPKKSQVGVMSTMPGNLTDLSQAYRDLYEGVEKEPGFLSLVDYKSIVSYREVAPDKAFRWKLDGCGPWFDPSEKNDNGEYCLEAHTQLTYGCVGHEAGATALAQFMEKQGSKRTFRQGAIVNVIFVSDTHDPGSTSTELLDIRPDADKLIKAIKSSNVVAGVKFHALAPDKKCTEEGMYGKFYYQLVGFTQGVKADPCITDDYTKPIGDIVENSSKIQEPNFILSKPAKKILNVYVDDKEYSDYVMGSDNISMVMKSLASDTEVEIKVVYEYE